jgi:hypothetical protein
MPTPPEERQGAVLRALMDAGSLAEIAAARDLAQGWLQDHPDDGEVAAAAARLEALAAALEELGLEELPPSTGAR